ncbi:NAD(P)H dehydrogenase (quinone) [Rhodobacter aestuarii]|uniref:NAD(P)H dehydrogenase (Quinone) n=1 Tax=Rhodobacter aestuarii TaxID=453582 RepID=A0A1N7PHU6_9RHOB|nr:NAD(P)H-binding protein [Rhodobacter aestuarii]PTV94408.1 NAD(P)H dehydrogenase (quinone) [Rhodobacter aestuarii]SIT10090.1 NAD(P)H dehydrogenase (quinone) [Rhodobacter aestuarii]
MTIAVTAATGQLGQLVLVALKARGAAPVALARSPEKVTGYEARTFDYNAPDAAALAGVEVLVLISSNDFNDRAGQHKRAIAAAKEAGVTRVVYTSVLKGDASPLTLLAADHIATEAALKESGLQYTLLRNGWYSENLTGALGAAIEHGAVIGAAGDGKLATAARADYAEAAAVAALDAAHAGKTYELAGDTAFTMAEFAAEVAAQSGKPVKFVNLPEAEYAKALEGFGVPTSFAETLAQSDERAGSAAGLFDDSHTLSSLIGRPTTPIAETIRAALA